MIDLAASGQSVPAHAVFRVLVVEDDPNMAALLLFVVTFLVNTAAELIRQRLRRRYARL